MTNNAKNDNFITRFESYPWPILTSQWYILTDFDLFFPISGGLGSYTPSKMGDNSFQLGVSRTVPHASSIKPSADTKQRPSTQNGVKSQSGATVESGVEEVLRPTEDAISWSGSSSSSDMLFWS